MLGPGLDRRRAERDARLLEAGLFEFLNEYEGRITTDIVQAARAGNLTNDRAQQQAGALTLLRDLKSACERAQRNLLRPQETIDGTAPTHG